MASKIEPVLKKLNDYFAEQQFEAASGRETAKWFADEDFAGTLREIVQELDAEAYGDYLESGEPSEAETPAKSPRQIRELRNQLTIAVSVLASYRRRYEAGTSRLPVSELDSRRYAMYSSKARKTILDNLIDHFNLVEEQ